MSENPFVEAQGTQLFKAVLTFGSVDQESRGSCDLKINTWYGHEGQ